MGNIYERKRGKNGAPSTTRNMNTGSVTHTHHAPGRKKGALGQHITKTVKSNGDVYLTETINYGDGSTKRTRTKQNKIRSFGSYTTNGKPARRSSGNAAFNLAAVGGGGLGMVITLAFLMFCAVVVFPLTVMFLFALPYIYPYILGAIALYILWKYLKK